MLNPFEQQVPGAGGWGGGDGFLAKQVQVKAELEDPTISSRQLCYYHIPIFTDEGTRVRRGENT